MIETLNKVETSFQGTQELSASKDLLMHTLPTCIKVGIDEMSFKKLVMVFRIQGL